MMKICHNCGHLNAESKSVCIKCNSEIDTKILEKIKIFAKSAVYYGYLYRIEYEKQVEDEGEVTVKYSLLEPSNYFELLAVFAISGYIGGIAKDMVKYIGKQLLNYINDKPDKNETDHEFQLFFNSEEELERFVKFIKEFYTGEYLNNKAVSNAIIEEQIADYVSQDMKDELNLVDKDTIEDKKKLVEFFDLVSTRVAIKRKNEKPSKEELKVLFKEAKLSLLKEKRKSKLKKHIK